MLTPIGSGLWDATQPLRVAGFDLGHRMVVMRAPNGEVAVHSPLKLSSPVAADVENLAGSVEAVRWIIAPSRMHDLYLAEWMARFPHAQLLHSPGMVVKGVEAGRMAPLINGPVSGFGSDLEALLLEGMPQINEVVFLHRPSRTLIVADLIFNLPPGRGVQKLLQKLTGVHEKRGPSKFFKQYISYEEGFRKSLEQVLNWDFDQIVVGHGINVTGGAKADLQQGFRWLFRSGQSGRDA